MGQKEVERRVDRRILRISLILSAFLLAAGLFCRSRYRLKSPVFFENEKVATVRSDGEGGWYADLSLRYVTDERDERRLRAVDFPELRERGLDAGFDSGIEDFQESGSRRGLYVVRTARGRIRGRGQYAGGELTITGGIAYFSDGSSEETELGIILLLAEPEGTFAKLQSSSSSSDGTEQTVYEMREDVRVEFGRFYLAPEGGADFRLTINREKADSSAALDIKEGKLLTLEGRWKPGGEDRERFIDRKAGVVFNAVSGGERQEIWFPIQMARPPEENSSYHIWNYLRQRGAF